VSCGIRNVPWRTTLDPTHPVAPNRHGFLIHRPYPDVDRLSPALGEAWFAPPLGHLVQREDRTMAKPFFILIGFHRYPRTATSDRTVVRHPHSPSRPTHRRIGHVRVRAWGCWSRQSARCPSPCKVGCGKRSQPTSCPKKIPFAQRRPYCGQATPSQAPPHKRTRSLNYGNS
jgi:hypothetical protein